MKNNRLNLFEFFEPHISGLFSTALRITGNINDANSTVRNTYRAALEFSDNFQKISNFKVWIFKILITTFISNNGNKNTV